MNAIARPAPEQCATFPRAVPLLSLTRIIAWLGARWDAWRERRAQRLALEALARLDPATLRDLGLESEAAARALARIEAARHGDGCYGRASVAPW